MAVVFLSLVSRIFSSQFIYNIIIKITKLLSERRYVFRRFYFPLPILADRESA